MRERSAESGNNGRNNNPASQIRVRWAKRTTTTQFSSSPPFVKPQFENDFSPVEGTLRSEREGVASLSCCVVEATRIERAFSPSCIVVCLTVAGLSITCQSSAESSANASIRSSLMGTFPLIRGGMDGKKRTITPCVTNYTLR